MFADPIKRLKAWARTLKANLILLWLCCRHPDLPWRPKAVALVTVAYAFSPVDLIPDFIPVLGFLDDVILLPLGIALALRMIPRDILQRCQPQAQAMAMAMAKQRVSFYGRWLMTAGIIALWLGLAWGIWLAIQG